MNKIFKTLKNHRTGAATAVSELQTGRTKGSGAKATVVAAAVLAALMSVNVAEARDWWLGKDVWLSGSTNVDTGTSLVEKGEFAFGQANAAKTYEEQVTVHGNLISPYDYTFYFTGLDETGTPTITLDLSKSMSVFQQSQGFDQALVQIKGGLTVNRGTSFSVDTGNGDFLDPNILEQLVEQNGKTVARGRYIIGERAQNLVSLGDKVLEGYDHGIKYDSTTFYTAAVLSELDIYDGETLQLDVSGEQDWDWGAHLTGEGGVAYVGDTDNKAENVVTIKQLYESHKPSEAADDRLDLANNYTGATTVMNVTLNLERETSLGASGILTADNANIVEGNQGALGELIKIDFTDTDLTTKDTPLVVGERATFKGANVLNVTGSFTVDGAVEISKGSLSTGTAAFDAGSLEVTDATLTASSVKVTGNATATGTNTLHADTVTVDGVAAVTSGSLLMDKAAFKAGTLDVTGATLTASSVEVTGNSTVSGGNTVTADTFKTTQKLTLEANATLDATGSLTAGTAQLSAGTELSAKDVKVEGALTMQGSSITTNELTGDVKVDGALTMQGSSITADTLTASGDSFTLSGVNTISTKNGATVENADVRLADGVTLDVAAGGLAVKNNMMVNPKALLDVTGGLTVGGTLTLVSSDFNKDKPNFVVDTLKVGKELAFKGKSYSDNVYEFGTPKMTVSALNTSYDVSLKNANVQYKGVLQNVETTTLDQAHLTLAYENAGSLGHVVMTNTSGSEKSQNLLTLKSDSGFVIDNRFSVGKSAAEDVIELSGAGDVTFADNLQIDSKYAGWIRMTGTTLNLPLSNMQNSTEYLSVSVGEGGTIAVSDDQQINLKRLGWAETSGQGGTLDLSKFDFSNLQSHEAAITVDDLTVNGNGTIKLDESAVQGLTVGTGDEGDSIFDALNGNDATLVISVTNEFDSEAVGGAINVAIEGGSNDDEKLTGYFGSSGLFMGDNDSGAAAKGTWGYGTVFDKHSLSVTHQLTEIELLDGQTLGLEVDGTQNQSVGAKLTGTGTLKKTGDGDLHLVNTKNTWTGSTVVESGTLVAEAGALGTGALTVGTGGTFILSGAQDEKADQTVKTLTVENQGLVKIGGPTTEHALELVVKNGGSFAVGSQLEGRADSLLALTGGTLTVTEIEDVAANFLGDIQVGEGATLVLKGDKDGTGADLSKVIGTGTIELRDSAIYAKDRTGSFTGTTKVLEGGKLNITADAKVDAGARLVMDGGESSEADIVSGKLSTFETIDLKNGTIDLGVATAGQGQASGSLNALGQVTLENVTLSVNTKLAAASKVDASGIFELGNSEGKTTWLLTGESVVIGDGVTIEGIETNSNNPHTSELWDGEKKIGSVTHTLEEEFDKNEGIGFTTKASSIDLTGELKLAGSLEAGADSTLELQVTGSDSGSIRITDNKVTLAAENTYGKLVVDDKAEAVLDRKQTLTQGGLISGKVSGKGGLDVTGGTLTVSETGSSNVAIRLDAENKTDGAELAFVNRKGSSVIYAGDVSGVSGARVSFENTTGDFSLASGTADYVLSGTSAVTFGPYADEAALKDTFTFAPQDAESTAYLDIRSAAKSIDLSGVTGNGKLALNYAEAGGTLNVAEMNDNFKGTLAFANATATIGTDESVKGSKLNRFATEQGELEVGAGSTLVVKNQKDRAADGSFTPHAVKLAGDLTISDRATLDFTAGVFEDHGTEHLGNSSGLSVNALDLNGNRFVVVDSGEDSKITVQARIDKLDFGTGLPSNGEYHGSILDMLGETPDYPVLTVIENIRLDDPDKADAISAIANSMVLEGVDEDDMKTVKFWQPNWDPESEHETVHVANVTTGVKLVGVENKDGLGSIAIGAGITGIDIVSGATLCIDASASESGASVMDASITENNKEKPGNVLVTHSLGNAPEEGVKFLAENTYTGETVIDFGAKATVGHESAFASSKVVRVGTMSKDANGNLLEDKSILVLDTTQVKGSSYENAVKMKAIELGANGKLEIKTRNDLILTGNGASTFAEDSVVTGDDSTTIGLADGNLTIENLESISGFEGAFRVNTGASVNFTVADTETYTWTNDVPFYTDARSRVTGAGKFVKSGAGTLVIGDKQFAQPNLSGMNLVVAEGTAELNGAKILGLETRKGTVVDVNGIFTTENLTADAGSVFNLDVVTGKPFNVKEGESTSKKSIWGLGENGSDGILVTGTASGTLNLAVTPKDVGAEESIQLVDAADTKDGFTVNLVDEKGAKLEGLTVGASGLTHR